MASQKKQWPWKARLAMGFVCLSSIAGLSQEIEIIPTPALSPDLTPTPSTALSSSGCSTCGSGQSTLLSSPSFDVGGGWGTCESWSCAPGRTPCPSSEAQTAIGYFLYRIYESFCCVDPCYEPRWLPIADAAFFADAVRPVTQQRFRWDANRHMDFPDRSEYFWARSDGKGRGPRPPKGVLGESGLNYNELSMYTEAATGAAGIFVEMPYRAVYPENYAFGAGFSDMNLGTKAVLLDSEFLLCGFQFRTFLPIGRAQRGLGTGHVSLEPSLLLAMKFSPETCFQGQLSQVIPLGGDSTYVGSLLHYDASMNRVLGHILDKDPVIGSLEFSGWSFQHGKYTDPGTGLPIKSSGETYASLGCGLRVFICDRIDFGFGASFAVTHDHWAEQLFRSELRWRY